MNTSRLRKNLTKLLKNNLVIDRKSKSEQLEIPFETVPESNGCGQTSHISSEKKKADYTKVFLVQHATFVRHQTYIEQKTFHFIKHFLSTVAPEMSVAGFISNILSKHLKDNKQEIEKLYIDKVNSMKTGSLW